jgi:hypothetical protein
VPPSVPPGTFTAGPAYDWRDPAAKPPFREIEANFANTSSFADTSRWIQESLNQYLAPITSPDREETSDIHFRGCILEWHVEELINNGSHINEYNHSVNLGDVRIRHGELFTGGLKDSLYVRWDTKANPVLARFWEKEDGKWKNVGERMQDDNDGPFQLQVRDNIAERLGYAFVHAARLCGAQP